MKHTQLHPPRFVKVLFLASVWYLTMSGSAKAVVVDKFDGVATDIGVQREPGGVGGVEYRVRGEFAAPSGVNLSNSSVILLSLLDEIGADAAGELLTVADSAPLLPIVLEPRRQSTQTKAVFETKRVFRPHIRLQVNQRAGRMEFRLKIDRALSRRVPALCSGYPSGQRSLFRLRFAIDDQVRVPIEVDHVNAWDCSNLEGFQLKARFASAGERPPALPPAPTDGSVTARLWIDAFTRTTGQPDWIELHGEDSEDEGGSIVRYVFESGDGRVQDGLEPNAKLIYAPGDYFVRLTVFDADGNAAATTRSFSEK